jgi:bifunctional DNA-binding transcriptional regulator/antitoxin component of YhaV-PrlF toxin-antitoxin module
MTTTLTPGGLIEIPEVFRKADALQPGQRCDIERTGRGEYRVRIEEAGSEQPREKLIDVLMSCPVKDWFVPMDRTETTDDLKPLAFE